jgi:CTP:molybdopterin cytidylyltransferase MocA
MISTRHDRAVIMARGLGARMGAPKGLLRLSPGGLVFVRMIADLYLAAGFGVDVVTRQSETLAYRCELPDGNDLRVLPAPDGGDTALTLLTAWRSWRAEAMECTHVWAHPVDLPLVAPSTIAMLREYSQGDPHRVLRPLRQGTPGHPVVLPVNVLEILDKKDTWQDGPLRNFLLNAAKKKGLSAPVTVEVSDPGIVSDFDRPEDFDPSLLAKDRRGAP